MSENEKACAAPSPAQIYEEFFVPALFHPWASVVTDAAASRRNNLCWMWRVARAFWPVLWPTASA